MKVEYNYSYDIYYYTPELPMFMFMQGCILTRIRTMKFYRGNLVAVLADFDYDNIGMNFIEEKEWNTSYDSPFYCLLKHNGNLFINGMELSTWLQNQLEINKEYYSETEEIFNDLMNDIETLHVPVFDSIEKAQAYVFGNKLIHNNGF